MTKLESVIQKINSLPPNEQEKIAEFIESFTLSSEDEFIFTKDELLEIDSRLKSSKINNCGFEEIFTTLN